MSEAVPAARFAWCDESFQEHDNHGFYIIAAAIIEPEAREHARKEMFRLQAKHTAEKLHWTVLEDRQRAEAARSVADIEGMHLVAVGAPVRRRKQERGRSKCLTALICELYAFGVEQLYMEARVRNNP